MLLFAVILATLVSAQDPSELNVESDPMQLNCTQAMLSCTNGAYIRQSDCMTKLAGPYENQRTTVCICPDGYEGQECNFVTDSSVCSNRTLSWQALPGPKEAALIGCQIVPDITSSILNLIDHYAYVDLNLNQSTMIFSVESRNTDAGFYSDVAEVIHCSLSTCESTFDEELLVSSATCNVHPGDCTGKLPGDDLFLPSLSSVTATFLPENSSGRVKTDLILQSLYPLPLNMACLAGRCV